VGTAFLVFPNQILKKLPSVDFDRMILAEDRHFFSDFNFHKKKLVFHRACLKYYQEKLTKCCRVSYFDHGKLQQYNGIGSYLAEKKIDHVYLYDPVDHELESRIKRELTEAGIDFTFLESELFICSKAELKEYFGGRKHFSMNSFYIRQRKRLEILTHEGKAEGGKWSFDKENRLNLKSDVKLPQLSYPKSNKFIKEAIDKIHSVPPKIINGKEVKVLIGLTGVAVSNYPEFARYLIENGIDYIGLDPDPESFLSMRQCIIDIEKK